MIKVTLFFLLISSAFAETPRAFKTDYCTMYAEGTIRQPTLWKHCCLEHDMFLWAGGTREEKNASDLGLKTCIAATGNTFQADLMYRAVRIGAHSPIKFPSKVWNNAWRDRPRYQALTQADIDHLQNEIMEGYTYISETMKAQFIETLRNR